MPVDKISEEWNVMRYFRETYDAFPKGKLVKSESPDFILKISRKKQIGIELTRFCAPEGDITGQEGSTLRGLKNLIRKKEDKLGIYRKKLLNGYWLIIHMETVVDEPEIIRIATGLLSPASSFDRVFLFDLFSAKIIELT